jgi:hypothetical protein
MEDLDTSAAGNRASEKEKMQRDYTTTDEYVLLAGGDHGY